MLTCGILGYLFLADFLTLNLRCLFLACICFSLVLLCANLFNSYKQRLLKWNTEKELKDAAVYNGYEENADISEVVSFNWTQRG